MNDIHSAVLLIVVLGMAKGYDDIDNICLVYSGNNLVVVVAVREL